MQDPQDIVWNTITDSAKTKFDFSALEKVFSTTGNKNLAENVLFLTIAGHAAEHSTEDIIADINSKLAPLAIRLSEVEFLSFVAARQKDLHTEILATRVALASFQMGAKPPGVLIQVRSILEAKSVSTSM